MIRAGESSVPASAFGIGQAFVSRIEMTRFGYRVIKLPVDPRMVGT
jgi:hypothetical protein